VSDFRARRDASLRTNWVSLQSWRPIFRKFDMMLMENGAHNNE